MATREAVTYLRVSGDSQIEGDGFPRQREAVARRARAMRYRIVQEFTDEGVSGTKTLAERPGLSALLARVLGNGVRVVLVEKADRLARDLVESELILREFRRVGVRVIEAESGTDLTVDDDNPTASLIRQVLGAVSQFEKSALVGKLAASRKRVRDSGKRCDGVRPFGMLDGEQETLNLIFELHNKRDPLTKQRKTPGMIAKELNEMKVKTRSGAAWSPVVVRTILKRGRKLDRSPSA